MGELYLPGAILFIVVLLQSAHGSVIQRRFGTWLDSALLPLARQERDAENNNYTMEVEMFNECAGVYRCLDTQYDGFHDVFGSLRLGQIYSSSSGWCSQQSGCWDNTCSDTYLKSSVQEQEEIVNWICDHRNEFLQAIPCFTDPFPAEMETCFEHRIMHSSTFDVYAIINEMRNCVANTLDNLPLCTSSSKILFMTLFNFVTEQQVKMYGA